MNSKKLALYTAEQTSRLDSLAVEHAGGQSTGYGYSLMKKAGASAFHIIMSMWPETKNLIVYCGTGNNGGDGYVVATLAHSRGMNVQVIQLGDIARQKGDAIIARQALVSRGVDIVNFNEKHLVQEIKSDTVIVDALLGIGITREVTKVWKQVIRYINQSSVNVAAIDVPSGLNVDTGIILGEAITADITITFIGRKPGLYTGYGTEKAGEVKFDSLNIPQLVYDKIIPTSWLLPSTLSDILLKPRLKNSHKGKYGKVLAVGGGRGMSGAILLAAKATLRTGCGTVTVLTHPQHADFLNINCPEIMSQGIPLDLDNECLFPVLTQLSKQDVLVVGPGLGMDEWATELFIASIQQAKELNKAVVIDADGLNLLGSFDDGKIKALRFLTDEKSQNGLKSINTWILTPHPGEAAALLKTSIDDIQNDRCKAAKLISKKFNAICVLKGSGTIICDTNIEGARKNNVYMCASGNPGMAVPGMGDVLTGIIGTLLSQKIVAQNEVVQDEELVEKSEQKIDEKNMQSDLIDMELLDVVSQAVMLHAMAGDEVAEINGEKGILASDLFPHIQCLINGK